MSLILRVKKVPHALVDILSLNNSVIDEAALVEDIDTKKIGGTGLDVFADKPNVPQALLNRGNVVVTPHIGSATHATRAAMAK